MSTTKSVLIVLIASVLFNGCQSNQATNWAVLIAGSSGYYNYRHQADICHAFQDLKAHGIDESKIIVMMYDDIALAEENPTPGIVVNQPNGSDLYHGVPKDWTGEDVTPENFIRVLLGDKHSLKKGKKVLQSGSNDNVFIYFADHGGTDIIGFPSDYMSSQDLLHTLKSMHKKKMYNNLVFYMEACESGSMFENLPNNMSIYATTAANSTESSFGCFWDPFRQAYMGDEYSVNWLIDSDVGKRLGNETLHQQFVKIKRETKDSHPQQFGDLSISKMPISAFQGSKIPPKKSNPYTECDGTMSEDIPKITLQRRLAAAFHDEKVKIEKKLNELIEGRKFMDKFVRKIVQNICSHGLCAFSEELFTLKQRQTTSTDQSNCYHKLLRSFHDNCFNLGHHYYATKYARVFYNLVNLFDHSNLDQTCLQANIHLKNVCSSLNHSFTRIE